ncbi:sodium- and chloride-dependent glycine transporter 1-like isoform X1 [Mizuhopecten yessoensis]|uniref:sodium- and chloride-dependent glycine transporter 1-like isoform X1 n=1 Tax=Mizuhopecten yessoensis TaxID=6573 RepID=UPI000B459566|nr:sodium- and chloride-dependent glycine transporter 1-like isoform X1 [Mizuhopecten yessoensis]XP_021377304.1 sodium- and chloride-dependent glycine transporter 1-like isoform X1 [Mizuhopecten yessoensis]XP_021377305.1 sodium- and chloride-dependent glycine transporter 1-like isoform X1 [Mizuhopecten yessoensis]XP_021377306.1 sodium- and chloride-dependent glycine transporter 1-like isoform X1 [Mizuhopecten yessoensis]
MSEKGAMDRQENVSTGSDASSGDENVERGNWSRKMDFMLSCLSYAVGLGNVWRFPYVCYRNGAGAFLIPFIIMLFVTGIPLVFMELSFGQYGSSGVVSIWKASPIFQGIGWAMFIVSVYICIYYNMIIAYTLYYLFASFTAMLPWSECGEWSTSACSGGSRFAMKNCSEHSGSWCNDECYNLSTLNQTYRQILEPNCTELAKGVDFRSPSDEYFHVSVLGMTSGVHAMGTIRWELVGCLALAWVLVALCLAKGIKTSGKAVYFTAFFPYIVLLILLVRSLTLDGSVDGIIYYLTPQWDKLLSARVWGDAAVQIFFSLSPCWGGLITLASYNKFHNNTLQDAVIVSILDSVTSVFAGLVIFSIIGYMAKELQQPIDKVASEGAGLAFVVYPEVVTKLPISQLWSILFFAMLITLGLGTQIATVTTVHTTLLDQFPQLFRRGHRSLLLLVGIAVGCFLVGLPFCTQGGMYVLQLFDNYAATYSLLIVGLTECFAIAWVYGADKFMTDIQLMTGNRPHNMWKYSWMFVAPVALLLILLFTWIDFKPTKYDLYIFPSWAEGCGFIIGFSSVILIPIVACYKGYKAHSQQPNKSLKRLSKVLPPPRRTGALPLRSTEPRGRSCTSTERHLSLKYPSLGQPSRTPSANTYNEFPMCHM